MKRRSEVEPEGFLAMLAAIIDLDVTFFFQLGLFLVLMLVLNFLVFRPMLALFDRRKSETEDRRRIAEEKSREAEVLEERFAREMATATRAGMEKKGRVLEEALRKEAELVGRERALAAKWMESELAQAFAEIQRVRETLKGEIKGLAAEVSSLLVEVPGTPRSQGQPSSSGSSFGDSSSGGEPPGGLGGGRARK